MLKIGVIGAGHLGKIHIRCLKSIPEFTITGFYDNDEDNCRAVETEFGIPCFGNIDSLIDSSDAIDIVTPTLSHFEYAAGALKKFRHVFIEKPIVTTPQEALKLMDIASEANAKVQVGHVERFNPAFTAALPFIDKPMFIETHRLAGLHNRGTDVPVILDLMIHDIDIVLHTVKANIRKLSASGVAVVNSTPDIANARLEFDNGCVANLTASRISMKNMRKTRFFQRDAYITVDFLNKETRIVRLKDLNGKEPDPLLPVITPADSKTEKQVIFETPAIEPVNAIETELRSFARSILQNTHPAVSILDGYNALKVAYQILEKVEKSLSYLE
ncbi:MAG TPA: Gfo/Idh/MocA family oxidoreductase [Bacteroidales bacterium]|nr:Gfo/Idh/MocA family oxidoreductase [Bacteroidales bacterium]